MLAFSLKEHGFDSGGHFLLESSTLRHLFPLKMQALLRKH